MTAPPTRLATPADFAAILRTWQEVGWVEWEGDRRGLETLIGASHTHVADLHGGAEGACMVQDGTLLHEDTELPVAIVGSISVSRVARRRGLGAALCAAGVAERAAAGSAVAFLGTFDQGFYDRLGFGSGPYVHEWTLDPADLRVDVPERAPIRLGPQDSERMHRNRLARFRGHGAVSVMHAGVTRSEAALTRRGFGLGYAAPSGELTHHVWMEANGEHGPYRAHWMAWRTPRELDELLGLIRSLGDQIHAVTVQDPPGIQLQDLISRPMHGYRTRKGGDFWQRPFSVAWWQARILDLPRCVAALHCPGPALRFGLELHDPITTWLPEGASWRGVDGGWTVELGETSVATPGLARGLPVLRAGVAEFTRFWLGALSARSLSATARFEAPESLLADLDRRVRLPSPHVDWEL